MIRRTLLCLMLAACGSSVTPPSPDTVTAQRFSDRKPVDWNGRTPQSYPVHGIDIARYQKTVDWPRAHAAGVNFAWVKATEGSDRVDPFFADNHDQAARAGVLIGAYHFFYWCGPPESQADWFIENVPRRRGDLPPVLDLEWTPFSPTCTVRPAGAEVRRRAEIFLDRLEAHYGQRPVIYTTKDFVEDTGVDRLDAELWLRSTAQSIERRYPGTPWRVWQYSATGRIDGITGDVDLNAFNGSERDWRNWVAARRIR